MMKRSWSLFLVMPLAALFPDCKTNPGNDPYGCNTGQSAYICEVINTGPISPFTTSKFWANNLSQAVDLAKGQAYFCGGNMEPTDHVISTTCTLQPAGPSPMPQGVCTAINGDDACMVCADNQCCQQYAGCSNDANCTCLVVCLFQGGTLASCTTADNCGAESDATLAIQNCLADACPSECPGVSSMPPTMCPATTGTGAGGSSTCTPGTFVTSDPCSRDADCVSCSCDTLSMTCN